MPGSGDFGRQEKNAARLNHQHVPAIYRGDTLGEVTMRWSHPTSNPVDDEAADGVIAAFEAAEQAGKPPVECYCAAVDAWLRAHPEQAPHYAARQAVEVIYASRGILLET